MTHSPSVSSRLTAAAGLALLVVGGVGCAGAWLERPLAAELPVEVPGTSYPTAVRSAAVSARRPESDDPEIASAHQVAIGQTPTEETLAAGAQPPTTPRPERQQPLMPTLAVIPPELVASPRPPAPPAAAAVPRGELLPTQADLPAGAQAPLPTAAPVEANPLLSSPAQHFASHVASPPPPQTAISAVASPAADAMRASPASANATPTAEATLEKLEKARADLIQALELEIRRRRDENPSDDELPRLEQQLRLVYLTAGRLDEAVAGVESLETQQQEAYKNLMFGLGVWLSPDEARRPPLRSAKVLHSLRDATTELASGSKLELKNLVFCERVDYFGWYTEFPKKEFQPKQQVILYVEVENFAAEHKGSAGYETELQGSYEILDAGGQIIASRQLQLDKETCRNYRRDYFLAYRIYMPDQIAPGRYRLELTVEDLKARGKYQGRKLGEGMIEFSIR